MSNPNVPQLTVNQKRILERFPWEQVIPLAIQLFNEVRRNGLSEEAIALFIQIGRIVFENMQSQQLSPDDWQDIWDLIMKFLPIIIELIGGLQSGKPKALQSSPEDWQDIWDMIRKFAPILIELIGGLQDKSPVSRFCDSAPRR